jgi:LysM repeat protein
MEQRIEELESRVIRLEVQVGILQGKIVVKDGRYQIRAGDTGLKIARMFEVSIPDLVALNPDVSWAELKIGQFIRMQAEESPPLQTPTSGTPAANAPVAPPSGAAGR